jgi:hypothetical protein
VGVCAHELYAHMSWSAIKRFIFTITHLY